MSEKPVSRREFAKRAVFASAAGTLASVGPLLPARSSDPPVAPQQDAAELPKLSAQSQNEADARFESILREYADRFSDAEKKDLRRLCYAIQQPLDHVRAYPVANGDAPALYLKPIVERERRQLSPSPATRPSAAKP